MKNQILPVFLLILAFVVSGCAPSSSNTATTTSPAVPTESPATGAPAPEPSEVQDKASLITSLQASGATVETGEPVSQPFFTPEATSLKVNGADVQVFEYESAEAMEEEASQVAPDGGSIGTSMVNWVDTPHFLKAGRIIVLYVGSDATILDLLEKALGPQFAGR
jgi:hypothetical protein